MINKSSVNIAQRFSRQALDYDNFFNRHLGIFQTEVNALSNVISNIGYSLVIGVGTTYSCGNSLSSAS